jgi:hypothetical protein
VLVIIGHVTANVGSRIYFEPAKGLIAVQPLMAKVITMGEKLPRDITSKETKK